MKKFNLLVIALMAWMGSMQAQSDVVVGRDTFRYDSLTNGGTLEFRSLVASYVGTTATFPSGSIIARFVISTDSIIDTTDILLKEFMASTSTTILPGANNGITYKDTLQNINTNPNYPKGVRLWVGIIADPHNIITETDETNNVDTIHREPNTGVYTVTFSLPSLTGIPHIPTETNFKLYPNPAQELITVQIPNMIGETIYIHNTLGQIVHQATIQSEQTSVNISNFAKGIYLLSIGTQGNRYQTRFVKE